jgi:hypothetical protein
MKLLGYTQDAQAIKAHIAKLEAEIARLIAEVKILKLEKMAALQDRDRRRAREDD